MAENTEALCRSIADYIALKLDIQTEYVADIPWQERERLFDRGEIQLLWLCGLPYVHKADLAESSMELLAVPVPAGDRYTAKPVYFSDIVVRWDSPFQSFLDLRGASWAYNEQRSHSGYNVVRAHLAELAEIERFFGTVVETGAHAHSLRMILSGEVDGAAIDSTVLEWIGFRQAGLMDRIRVIDSLGPSPIPPWVISKTVAESLRRELRDLFLSMDADALGRDILKRGRLERFEPAEDSDFDPIRRMAREAERVLLA